MPTLKDRLYRLLRASERYTKTDMVYLAQSGFWLNLGTVVLSVCSLLLYIVLANVLTKIEYGTYQYLLSVGAILSALTLTGMNTSVARAVAQGFEGTLASAIRMQLLWGIIPFLAGCAGALYYLLNGNALLATGFLLLAVFTPFYTAFNTYGAYFQGKKDFRSAFTYGLFWHLPFYAALITVAFAAPFALAILFANLLVQSVATAMLYLRVADKHVTNNRHDPGALSYGAHLSVMNVPATIAAQLDAVLAFHFLGPVALALYSFATAIPERLSGFFKFLPTATLPQLAQKSFAHIRIALSGARLWWVVALCLAAALLYTFCAPLIFALLFPTYMDAVTYSQWYSLLFLGVIGNLFLTGLTAGRAVRKLYIFNIVVPIAQIIFQVIGVLCYGLWGLIVAKLATVFGSTIVAGWLLFTTRDPGEAEEAPEVPNAQKN